MTWAKPSHSQLSCVFLWFVYMRGLQRSSAFPCAIILLRVSPAPENAESVNREPSHALAAPLFGRAMLLISLYTSQVRIP